MFSFLNYFVGLMFQGRQIDFLACVFSSVSMRDLAAQVTSSLLRFPEVTIDALGEDEVTLDSVLHGRFTVGESCFSVMACPAYDLTACMNPCFRFFMYVS